MLFTFTLKGQVSPFQISKVKEEVVNSDKKNKYVNVEYQIFNNSDSVYLFDKNWVLKKLYVGKKEFRDLDKFTYITSSKFHPPNSNYRDTKFRTDFVIPYLHRLLKCNSFDISEQLIDNFEDAIREFYTIIEPKNSYSFIDNYVIRTCKKSIRANYEISDKQLFTPVKFTKNNNVIEVKNCY